MTLPITPLLNCEGVILLLISMFHLEVFQPIKPPREILIINLKKLKIMKNLKINLDAVIIIILLTVSIILTSINIYTNKKMLSEIKETNYFLSDY